MVFLQVILIDNATGLGFTEKYWGPPCKIEKRALLDAQKNCFAAGLTTIDDCGLNYRMALLINSLQESNELK